MRGKPQKTHVLYLSASPSQVLCLQASVNWRLDESTADCQRVQKDKTHSVLLQIGTKAAIPYTLSGCDFHHWIGTVDEVAAGPNYLAVLTLGWCYILSARLVEIQGEDGAAMTYTESKTTGNHDTGHDAGTDEIDIGEADGDAVSWWSAVLAPGEGWRAIIKRCDDGEFLAPWSLTSTCKESLPFRWHRKKPSQTPSSSPMSSSKAFELLANFALVHNLGSQFLVAFAAAMTVPTHNYYGTTFQLPYPKRAGAQCPAIPAISVPREWSMLLENLDYYMTLSCNSEAVISSLCGTFWEPGVPCNLVAPWLHPILNELPEQQDISEISGLHAEILAIIGGVRRPTISALWLGAAVGGLTPTVLRRIKRGRPPLDPVAFPWTGSPQSFTDVAGTGPYVVGQSNEEVWRADVWRLFLLPPTEEDELSYNYRPSTPWEPCGRMNKKDCALRVVAHLSCARHHFNYCHWNWELKDGSAIEDKGFTTATPTPATGECRLRAYSLRQFPHKPLDQEASEEASLDIFRWFIINGEGVPSEKIHEDEWLKGLEDDEDSDEEDQAGDNVPPSTTQKERHDCVEQWLSTIS